ncbi:hypothetical protein C0V72_03890 [Porphyrobacter sp. TH134]|nr:hypothetical protein C0V72_03890 [Porphyrobacter sp. TH134]
MAGHEEGFFVRNLARFVRGWSLDRAKIAFVISTPIYTCVVLYTHVFEWPVSLAEGASFVAGASTLTSVIAFFSKHVPEFNFD